METSSSGCDNEGVNAQSMLCSMYHSLSFGLPLTHLLTSDDELPLETLDDFGHVPVHLVSMTQLTFLLNRIQKPRSYDLETRAS